LLPIDGSIQIPVQHQSTGWTVNLPLAQLYFPQQPTPGTVPGGRKEPVGQFDLASTPGACILQLSAELAQADICNGLR
jgi:hypothetical protein